MSSVYILDINSLFVTMFANIQQFHSWVCVCICMCVCVCVCVYGKNENSNMKRYVHLSVHKSTISNHKGMETTHTSINRGLPKRMRCMCVCVCVYI